MHKGSCLCGAVTFEVEGAIPQPDACHCTQCRKFSGHFFVSSDIPRTAITIHGLEHVSWYPSSEKVQRGFCSTCGASLFFDPLNKDKNTWLAIALGAFDGPTHTTVKEHIFVANKGDYYELNDGLPQDHSLSPPG